MGNEFLNLRRALLASPGRMASIGLWISGFGSLEERFLLG
jgi:hypothetical protein